MAAKSTDSKRIFDLYVNRYLLEADGDEGPARSKESSEPGKGVEAAKTERAQDVSNASKAAETSSDNTAYRQPDGSYGTEPKADNGSTFTAVGDNSASGAGFVAQGDPAAAQQNQAFGQGATDRAVDKFGGAAPQKTWTQQNIGTSQGPIAEPTPTGNTAPAAKPANMSDADFQKMLDQQYADFKKQGANAQMSDADFQKMLDQQYADFQKTGQAPAIPQQAQQAATPTPPSKEDIQRYGQTGAELRQSSGGQFMSRGDRMDQAKVDSILGKGKYKAGTAEANLALADYFKKNPATVTPGRPGTPAGSTAATTAAPAASTPAPAAPATSTAATGVNVPSWRNQPGVNQGQGPTQINALKQAVQKARITLTDDQINQLSQALGMS